MASAIIQGNRPAGYRRPNEERGSGWGAGGGRAESSHCWESPRAFSVKSKYKLALSVHPGARIASVGILAIQIKCCDLDCRIDTH